MVGQLFKYAYIISLVDGIEDVFVYAVHFSVRSNFTNLIVVLLHIFIYIIYKIKSLNMYKSFI